MSKKKKSLKKDTNKKHVELNGKRIRFLSADSSIYDTSSTFIFRGKLITKKQKNEAELLEFLSRAPISFNDECLE